MKRLAEYDIQPRVNSVAPFSGLDGIMENDGDYVMTTPVFSDDMSASSNWFEFDGTNSGRRAWHLDTTTYTSAPSSAATGPYGNDWEQWLITTDSISLDGLTHPGIQFEWFVDTEYEHDYAYVGISKDGRNFNLTGTSGNYSGFVEETVDLTDYFDGIDYTGKDIWIAFLLESDESTTGNGV